MFIKKNKINSYCKQNEIQAIKGKRVCACVSELCHVISFLHTHTNLGWSCVIMLGFIISLSPG